MSKERVLLIEDDEEIAGFVELELTHEGYQVTVANDGRDGLRKALDATWDLLLLDVMLPGMSGLEVCRRIRLESTVPIIMLTAKGGISDRVAGIDYGADDYLIKPFAIEELMARMRGLLRRAHYAQDSLTVLSIGDLTLHQETRDVKRGDVEIRLTPREFDLLRHLIENKGHVLSRENLLHAVWGYDFSGETNVVDVYVRYLRAKVDEGFSTPLIHTVRGVGYVMKE
ncbi:response regulator transcription factor [Ferroacidibacillus organovorans]|uniref:DNA-binding response regulator n=1 Tax=Ferroacidibacillus organovorans TaxID=1765683 RepID=A0A161QH41_9BACL|nr:response regulator transcription factor [Ferroacidibacillus organovorans]KYP81530.1 DNA-binding response regulator [Ferroacidibacillus organovorans]OAG94037.1 PhoB family transcriptional regulator [Ferroacidibacillus organovorans]OPG16885.1 DNA-binding response regulator [Ferroacidibacillus organovorans]